MHSEICMIDAAGDSATAVAPAPFSLHQMLAWIDRWAPVWPSPIRAVRIDRAPSGPPLKSGKGMA